MQGCDLNRRAVQTGVLSLWMAVTSLWQLCLHSRGEQRHALAGKEEQGRPAHMRWAWTPKRRHARHFSHSGYARHCSHSAGRYATAATAAGHPSCRARTPRGPCANMSISNLQVAPSPLQEAALCRCKEPPLPLQETALRRCGQLPAHTWPSSQKAAGRSGTAWPPRHPEGRPAAARTAAPACACATTDGRQGPSMRAPNCEPHRHRHTHTRTPRVHTFRYTSRHRNVTRSKYTRVLASARPQARAAAHTERAHVCW